MPARREQRRGRSPTVRRRRGAGRSASAGTSASSATKSKGDKAGKPPEGGKQAGGARAATPAKKAAAATANGGSSSSAMSNGNGVARVRSRSHDSHASASSMDTDTDTDGGSSAAGSTGAGPRPRAPSDFTKEDNSFEPWFNRTFVDPIQRVTPRWVHPNYITVMSAMVIVVFTIMAAAAGTLPPLGGLAMRVGVGACVLVYAVGDSLDGVHARATGQCSKTGEALDHWVDSFGVPLNVGSMAMVLMLDDLTMGLATAGAVLTFTSELAIYHSTGRFVAQEASGTLGQIVGGMACIAAAVMIFSMGRDWVVAQGVGVAMGIAGTLGLWGNIANFARIMGPGMTLNTQGPTGLMVGALVAVYLHQAAAVHPESYLDQAMYGATPTVLGKDAETWFTSVAMLCTLTLMSVRVSGTYVLATRIGESFSGFDPLAAFWTVCIVAGHLFRAQIADAGYTTVLVLLPFAAFVVMAVVSVLQLRRALGILLEH